MLGGAGCQFCQCWVRVAANAASVGSGYLRRCSVQWKPRFHEPLDNQDPVITNDILQPDQSYSIVKCMEQNPDVKTPVQ